MPGLLTPAEYARRRKDRGLPGGTKQAVSKRLKKGDLEGATVRREGRVLLDPERADALWDQASQKPGGQPGRPEEARMPQPDGRAEPLVTQSKASTALIAAKAAKANLEYQHYAGKLVRREAVAREAFTAMRITRDQLRAIPAKLAVQLADEGDPQRVRECLAEEVAHVLKELERRFARLSDVEPPGE